MWWQQFKVDVPTGRRGPWAIERYTVTREDANRHLWRCVANGIGERATEAGIFTRLVHDTRGIIMSDSPAEITYHYELFQQARGQILMAGLGLGMATCMLARKPEVEHITVLEIDADVIALTGPHLMHKYQRKLTILQADVNTWKPPRGTHYDLAWFDIWDSISADNPHEMGRLKRRFCRVAKVRLCWAEKLARREARRFHSDTGRWPWENIAEPAVGGDPMQPLANGIPTKRRRLTATVQTSAPAW